MQAQLAKAYSTGGHSQPSEQALYELGTLIFQLTLNAYSQGWKSCFVDYEVYPLGFNQMKRLTKEFKDLSISTLHNNSLILNSIQNLQFRFIHDIHHLELDADFSMEGEFRTAQHIMAMTDNNEVKQILFSEIALQAAYALEYGEFAKEQKVVYLY